MRDRVRAALCELARDFAAVLPAQAEALARAFAHARANAHDGSAREALRFLAHRLRGTAGSHGFQSVTDDAAAIEEALIDARDGVATAAWDRLAEHVANIEKTSKQAAEDARTSTAP